VTSTTLFLVATVHIGASLQQLLEAFVYAPADVPDYSKLYWFFDDATPNIVKNFTFLTLVCNACALVCQSDAEGNNEVVHPRLCYSKFNVATIM